jgi:hypothetical protein
LRAASVTLMLVFRIKSDYQILSLRQPPAMPGDMFKDVLIGCAVGRGGSIG